NPLLLRLLELSRFFLSYPTRVLALGLIKARSWGFSPSLLIRISFEHNTRLLFNSAFHRLATTCLRDLTSEDFKNRGVEIYVALATVKVDVQCHRQVVAAEPAVIDELLATTCSDKVACACDWHAVWWNGMGRFLLDGHNPLSWTVSIERFEGMEFGEMGAECKVKMLKLVRTGDVYAHSYNLITGVAAQLMQDIVEDMGEGSLGPS
ncbi:hypothetical protein B0H17DRAFT_949562, partial [Mycena rosella]